MFQYLIWMIIQYICMLLFYSTNSHLLQNPYTYTMDNITHNATIYTSSAQSKPKILLIISGSYNLTYDVYIKKLVNDLYKIHPSMIKTYQIIVFEKLDKSSIIMHKDIAQYIADIHSKIPIEELIIIGFSSGGVVASHIMHELSEYAFNKKIITYDTPYQVHDNVSAFGKNLFYRIDIYFFSIVYDVYKRHYNYAELQHKIDSIVNINEWFNGADKMMKLICSMHNFTHEELLQHTQFCFAQSPNTKIINIYNNKDPFVNRQTHINFMKNNNVLDKQITNIEKNTVGHCSDMSFGHRYLHDIVENIIS